MVRYFYKAGKRTGLLPSAFSLPQQAQPPPPRRGGTLEPLMRGLSLRLKINLAIFVAFLAGSLAFGAILGASLAGRQAATHNRTRALLAILAAHRLEALAPLLDEGRDLTPAKDILERLLRVEGVTEAALFSDTGTLLSSAGQGPVLPVRSSPGEPLPTGRIFAVTAGVGSMTATLVEPVVSGGRNLGFLRLRYSLADLNTLRRHIWLVFGLAVVGAYVLLAVLLNLLVQGRRPGHGRLPAPPLASPPLRRRNSARVFSK